MSYCVISYVMLYHSIMFYYTGGSEKGDPEQNSTCLVLCKWFKSECVVSCWSDSLFSFGRSPLF